MIPLKDQAALKQRFARDLTGRVRVDFFSQKPSPIFIPGRQDCVACEDVRQLMRELSGLDRRIELTQHDIGDDAATAKSLGVDKVPGIVLRGAANRPLRYFGSPASRQFATFVEVLLMVARGAPNLAPETLKTLRRIKSDIGVKVFVTPHCVHSPGMVMTAARIALQSPRISLDIIEVGEFPQLVQRYYVRGTPHVVINDLYAMPGVMDEARLVENLLLVAQDKEPTIGGDITKLTPLAPPQPQQQTRPSPGSGLVLPR